MASFGDTLRQRRRAQQLTLAALGAQVDATQGYLSLIERNHYRPSAALVERLAAALQADPDTFHTLAGTTPPEPPASDLGVLLVGARQQRNWQQAELADRLGIDRSYLSQIERGNTTPSDRLLVLLAETLAVPLDDLRRAAKRVDTAALLARAAEVDGLRDLLAAIPLMSVPDLEQIVQCWRDIDAADRQG